MMSKNSGQKSIILLEQIKQLIVQLGSQTAESFTVYPDVRKVEVVVSSLWKNLSKKL